MSINRKIMLLLSLVTIGSTASIDIDLDKNKVYATDKDSISNDLQSRRNELGKISDSISKNTLEKEKLQKKIDKSTAEIKQLEESISKKSTEIDKRKEDLAKSFRSTQVNEKNKTFLDRLLSSESISDVTNSLVAQKTLSDAKSEKLDSIKEESDKLSEQKIKLEKEKDSLNKNKEDLDKVSEKLSKDEDNIKDKISELESKYKSEIDKENKQNQAVQEAQKEILNLPTGKVAEEIKTGEVKSGDVKAQSNIVATASQFIGVPYVSSGSSPSGFDCSGLTYYVFSLHGISLPRISQSQSTMGVSVPLNQLEAGDLVFWGGVGSAYHVGIYVGNGSYIHSPVPGQTVTYQSMSAWSPDFARRVL